MKPSPVFMMAIHSWLLTAALVLPPPGWLPFEPWTDEFEGSELNRSKWMLVQPGWPGRIPGLFDANNVKQADGKLQLSARPARRNASWPTGYVDLHRLETALTVAFSSCLSSEQRRSSP